MLYSSALSVFSKFMSNCKIGLVGVALLVRKVAVVLVTDDLDLGGGELHQNAKLSVNTDKDYH
jgi:hypothetical protein